jgi:hypothetical protein
MIERYDKTVYDFYRWLAESDDGDTFSPEWLDDAAFGFIQDHGDWETADEAVAQGAELVKASGLRGGYGETLAEQFEKLGIKTDGRARDAHHAGDEEHCPYCDYPAYWSARESRWLHEASGSECPGSPEEHDVPSRQDVEIINRHRAGLGMPPMDPSSGWTGKELREMAESIRRTGRTHNPSLDRLKRKLMR